MTSKSKQKESSKELWSCWCRVSTLGQKKKDISLPEQERRAVEYIKNIGGQIKNKHRFIDQVSGKKVMDSPEWQRLERCMAKGEIVGLATEDVKRLGRTALEALVNIERIIKEYNVKLVLVRGGGEVNLKDPVSKLIMIIQAAFAEADWDYLVRKSRAGLVEKLNIKGERNMGHLIYGLTWAPDKKAAELSSEEYPIVRLIVELRLLLKWSYTKIADFLNNKIDDVQGKRIAEKHKIGLPATYRCGKPWDYHRIRYIFGNPKYYLGESSITLDGVEYKYQFPPLMSKSEYIGARKIIPWYIKSTSRRSYLLSEKAICGLCGAPLWHNIIRNKYKGRIKEYQYYACRNKVQKPVDAEPCKLPSIPQDWLEHEVWEQMQSFFGNQEKFERVILQANCQLAEDRKQLDDIADRIVTVEKEIEDIETKQQNITGAIAKGIITDDEARKAMANLRNLKTNLQDEESELELKQSTVDTL
jgi:hypothetical protein